MKKLLLASLLVVSVGVCLAEDVVLPSDAIMRGDRSLTSVKAGTTVEVVARGDKTITIRYKGQTGTIPVSSLAAKDRTPAVHSPVVAKAGPSPTPSPKKSHGAPIYKSNFLTSLFRNHKFSYDFFMKRHTFV